jgi:hypothetical protein
MQFSPEEKKGGGGGGGGGRGVVGSIRQAVTQAGVNAALNNSGT